jgi:hypothetical protein
MVDAGEASEARLSSAGIEAPIKQGADRDSTVSQPVGCFVIVQAGAHAPSQDAPRKAG